MDNCINISWVALCANADTEIFLTLG